jgi:hypothetical protein
MWSMGSPAALSDMLAKALDSLSNEYREVIALRDMRLPGTACDEHGRLLSMI